MTLKTIWRKSTAMMFQKRKIRQVFDARVLVFFVHSLNCYGYSESARKTRDIRETKYENVVEIIMKSTRSTQSWNRFDETEPVMERNEQERSWTNRGSYRFKGERRSRFLFQPVD